MHKSRTMKRDKKYIFHKTFHLFASKKSLISLNYSENYTGYMYISESDIK